MHFYENGFRGFLWKGMVFAIGLYLVFLGHIQMDGTPTRWLDGLTDVHGKL